MGPYLLATDEKRGSRSGGLLLAVLASLLLLCLAGSPIAPASGATAQTGSGTFADSTASYVPTSQSGQITMFAVSGTGISTGTLSGSYTFSGTLQANDVTGLVHYSLIDIFTVVVDGKSGSITIQEIGHGSSVTSTFASQFNFISGTGGLTGLSGQGKLEGTQNPVSLLDTGTYTLSYSFS